MAQSQQYHTNPLPVLLGVICAAALLTLRAALPLLEGLSSSLEIARVTLPALVTLVMLIISVDVYIRGDQAWLHTVERKTSLLAFTVYATTLSLCALDLASGYLPYLILPGFVVLGTVLWNRTLRMLMWSTAGAALISVLAVFWQSLTLLETLTIVVFSLVLALFGAYSVRRNLAPTKERLKLVESENQELWALSYRDALTGLYNRRYLQKAAPSLFSKAQRHHEELHVLMLDIDHFKRVNDKLGHAVGDQVLKGISDIISTTVRASDLVARYGGEEFIVYLPEANAELVQFLANRIRDAVSMTQFPAVPWPLTISIGLTGLQEGDSPESLVERADRYLYLSKHQGRNRVSGF